jgi:hypothetical protein
VLRSVFLIEGIWVQVAMINGPETGKVGTILRVVRANGTVLVDGVRLQERCAFSTSPFVYVQFRRPPRLT